jgi:hypothetical protein
MTSEGSLGTFLMMIWWCINEGASEPIPTVDGTATKLAIKSSRRTTNSFVWVVEHSKKVQYTSVEVAFSTSAYPKFKLGVKQPSSTLKLPTQPTRQHDFDSSTLHCFWGLNDPYKRVDRSLARLYCQFLRRVTLRTPLCYIRAPSV